MKRIPAVLCLIFFCISVWAKGPLRNSRIPRIVPDTEVKPISPEWPKELVKMYDTTTILFIGDVMQHGYQIRSAHIKGKDPNKASSYNYSHTFKYLKERLRNADFAVANMEFPVGLPPFTGYPTFSAPESILTEAIESGIDLFQIANNHILDKGRAGLERTLNIYDSLGVHYLGAYRNSSIAKTANPKIIELNGLKFAFINFTYGTNGFRTPEPYVVDLMDSTKVKEAVARAHAKGADMIVALPHWGEEYRIYPSGQQKEWAKMLFKAGVKIIIGTHPHVPQTAELHLNRTMNPRRYGAIEKMVFYSLGNYISNQSIPDYTQLGMLVKVHIVKNNITGEITLCRPEHEYLWCFKKNEFEPDYTVVPLADIMENPSMQQRVKEKKQLARMVDTYNFILNKKLVKELYP